VADLRPLLEEEGRDFSEIDLTSRTILSIGKTHQEAVERLLRSRIANRFSDQDVEKTVEQNLIGTPAEIMESIADLQKEGMTQCVVQNIAASTFDEMVEQVQIFGEEVLPAFNSG
jgi:alkanesulfonate monooxygenase SsuD/methylene tetrahydromethanopterin reductase-like flavin-dependent oxidoreductase (luciferase family)